MKPLPDCRRFIQALGLTVGGLYTLPLSQAATMQSMIPSDSISLTQEAKSIIGSYGSWAASLLPDIPALSFRNDDFTDAEAWRAAAKKRLLELLAMPELDASPKITIHDQYTYDGLEIEELSWQLPYGRPTEAIFLKPQNASQSLPGILAFHDHGGNKYFGKQKITQTGAAQHPLMEQHQAHYYEGRAWANELAKRGYAVLVSDAFTFASRRVLLADVPPYNRGDLSPVQDDDHASIEAYNRWAGQHEHIMAKSLFCAGTTWPGVFLAEDQMALNILSQRDKVDSNRLGCAGLSGGGLRTVMLAGIDERIKCAVPVGFMTTRKDFLLNKSFTHTWMVYIPLLPKYLDFPEILGLRAPLPTLVQNDEDDSLYTLPEMKRADEQLQAIFQKMSRPNHYRGSFYPGPHKFDQAMQAEAFEWFDQWLT